MVKRVKTRFGIGPLLWTLLVAMVALAPTSAAAQLRLSSSSSTTQTFTDEAVTERIDTFSTQIIGRLNGGAPLYDETFPVQFSDPSAQAGVMDARAAITTAGGPGVIIGAPVRTSSVTSLQSSTTATTSVITGTRDVTGLGVVTFGPADLTVGAYGVCERVPGNPGAAEVAASGCSLPGVSLVLSTTESNINVHTDTEEDILRTTTTTETYLTAEVYELLGVNGAAAVQPVGFVHTAVQSFAFDLGGRFLQRLGQEGASSSPSAPEGGVQRVSFTPGAQDGSPQGSVWAEGYVLNANGGGGSRPHEDRDAHGFAAGVTFAGVEGFTFGLGVDRSDGKIRVDSAAERADLDLTQIGGFVRYDSGAWFVSAAGTYGFGDIDATRSLLGVSRTKYDVRLGGGAVEIGYAIDAFDMRITPTAAIDYLRVKTDGFSESGALGLRAGSHSADRTRALLGFVVFKSVALENSQSIDLAARIRGVAVLDGRSRTLPVAFAAAPGANLSVRGSPEGRFAAEIGAGLKLNLSKSLALTAAYDGRFSRRDTVHAGRAGVTLSW